MPIEYNPIAGIILLSERPYYWYCTATEQISSRTNMPVNKPDNQLCQYTCNINHELDNDYANTPIVYPEPTNNDSADTPAITTR